GFIQDDFRIRPNLMLNLGFRYEYFSVPREEQGRLYNPDGPLAALLRPVKFRPADSEYDADFSGYSPRLGFVWNPDKANKTVIRSGAGIFKAQPLLNNVLRVYSDPKAPTRFTFSTADVTALGLIYPMSNDDFLKLISTRTVPAGYGLIDPHYRNPYSVQW